VNRFDGRHRYLLIIDDFMNEVNQNVCSIFTKLSHHRDVSVIFLTQNLFHRNKHVRTRALHGPKFHGPARASHGPARPVFIFALQSPARPVAFFGPARPVMFSAIVARPGPFTFSLNGLYYRIPTNKLMLRS
jgi:hypothetical protein